MAIYPGCLHPHCYYDKQTECLLSPSPAGTYVNHGGRASEETPEPDGWPGF